MDKQMRIAFTGPSGSGKTTLVTYIQEQYGLPWWNGSSGGIKTGEQNNFLSAAGLAVGKGHAEVIRTGHMNPEAAKLNQEAILESRIAKFAEAAEKGESFVTDRSLFDNIVYYLMQVSLYQSERDTKDFIDLAMSAMNNLTHIIYIPTSIPIENNGSRVPNWYYQKAVNGVFKEVLMMAKEQKQYDMPIILELHDDRLKKRKEHIDAFLTIKRRVNY
jgi:adenylylsulfate kinase-like enzyme